LLTKKHVVIYHLTKLKLIFNFMKKTNLVKG